jgi:hypothetical protein
MKPYFNYSNIVQYYNRLNCFWKKGQIRHEFEKSITSSTYYKNPFINFFKLKIIKIKGIVISGVKIE